MHRDECREYCSRGTEEARECLDELGPYMPAEAKERLTGLARGEDFRDFSREGEFCGEVRREIHEEFGENLKGSSEAKKDSRKKSLARNLLHALAAWITAYAILENAQDVQIA